MNSMMRSLSHARFVEFTLGTCSDPENFSKGGGSDGYLSFAEGGGGGGVWTPPQDPCLRKKNFRFSTLFLSILKVIISRY